MTPEGVPFAGLCSSPQRAQLHSPGLGGGDPLQFIQVFGPRIRHVHWKDLPESWSTGRGKICGCGMAFIPVRDVVVGIEAMIDALRAIGFNGPTTLEVAGRENMLLSSQRLCATDSKGRPVPLNL